MITARAFAGNSYAVFGLARTGLAVVRSLTQSGAQVLAWDDGEAARTVAAQQGVALADLYKADFKGLKGLILSPGIPLYFPKPHPLVEKARLAGVAVMGDIELFAQARPELPAHKLIGITGTNGKSTTTALLHHVLTSAGKLARQGGNIGLPILGEEPLAEDGAYVLELSSFQIDLTQSLACDVAILTNITPDHLDRHGDMASYAHAKERLFEMQSPSNVAIIGTDDEYCRAIASRAKARLIAISSKSILSEGISVVDGRLRVNGAVVALQEDWPRLQGPHNAQNAAAVYAAAQALGLDTDTILAGFATYTGLAHRMEFIAELEGVTYLNDSKATNPTSTAPALAAYPRIHWIAGGKPKTDELNACLPHLSHVRAAYVIGEAADMFDRLLKAHIPVVKSGTIEQAIKDASAAAQPGDVVLLSPACASYDQFKDFEERGAAFRAAVEALKPVQEKAV